MICMNDMICDDDMIAMHVFVVDCVVVDCDGIVSRRIVSYGFGVQFGFDLDSRFERKRSFVIGRRNESGIAVRMEWNE